MKIWHTSDWHLGRALYGRKRYEEFDEFLQWLSGQLATEKVDVLLVAGDVFDNGTPSNRALEQYYRFLCRTAATGCRHVVITGGNHDSPALLNAPREILRNLNVHVVGCISPTVEEEVIVLDDADGVPALIVCAVPYLRDRDIRRAEAGETFADKGRKLAEGIREHYAQVTAAALARQAALGGEVPIVATGHLFATGGQTLDGDGVRDLYVGSLGQVGTESFPDALDYVALGHLHVAQRVGGSELRRYAGAPLPMSFGEAGQGKKLLSVEIGGGRVTVQEREIPSFQKLATLRGDWDRIASGLRSLVAAQVPVWLEVVYDGQDVMADLQERLRELTEGTLLEILRVRNLRVAARSLGGSIEETLDDLEVEEVFARCLQAHQVPEPQREELLAVFRETVVAVQDQSVEAL